MAYGAYVFIGTTAISALCSIGYLISCIFKKTRIMFSLALCSAFNNFVIMLLYMSVCHLINNYDWAGSLVIVIILLIALILWYIRIIRCIWQDINAGCYSESGKSQGRPINHYRGVWYYWCLYKNRDRQYAW